MTPLRVDPALAGRRLLLTGSTGFIGKAVLQTLVRELPGIARIVLLLRGGDAERRFHAEVLPSTVFDALRRDDPRRLQAAVERMRFVDGDITAPRLGLTEAGFAQLAQEIDVVVHVAASVDFREPLDQALAINALALRDLSRLARIAGAPLVQVSTCYVNGLHRGTIAEELLPPAREAMPRHLEGYFKVDALVAELQSRIAALKRRVPDPQRQARALVELGLREAQRRGWNDTYTFTKWIGEQVAARELAGATLTIVRPAIVESALRTPQPGWIEGVKVGDAIVLAYARGKTSLFPARPAGVADIVPVDLVANAIVLAAAQALAQPGRRRIVQVGSSTRNPVRVGEYVRLCRDELRAHQAAYPRLVRQPLSKPFRTVPRSLFIGWLAAAHGVAWVAQRLAQAFGLRRRLALAERIETTRQLATTFSFYTSPHCVFDGTRLLEMAAQFDAADRARFEVDASCFEWRHYVTKVHLPGLERYGVREDVQARTPVVLSRRRGERGGRRGRESFQEAD